MPRAPLGRLQGNMSTGNGVASWQFTVREKSYRPERPGMFVYAYKLSLTASHQSPITMRSTGGGWGFPAPWAPCTKQRVKVQE